MEDLKALPNNELRKAAIFVIHNLVTGLVRGKPLEQHADRDLGDCRKAFFSTLDEQRRRIKKWRIVYQQLPPRGENPQPHIHIVAIGSRAGLEVYETAARRLGRLPENAPELTQGRAAAARLRPSTTPAEPTANSSRQQPTRNSQSRRHGQSPSRRKR
ncbi:hypothetical protein OG339_48680 (plasmid) [Streptosporangium sp. NBC_01495]|uniref:hypothetical protein n=1 Tax=Streptosporangium sp. NBC_01495 TaxID=2903899 RepID=UPI002E347B28|nr:hypothetical protein [Streptosporangium sp. NBC_01495]